MPEGGAYVIRRPLMSLDAHLCHQGTKGHEHWLRFLLTPAMRAFECVEDDEIYPPVF